MGDERRLKNRFTYREVVEHYGLRLCTEEPENCKRKLSGRKHRYGGADSMGVHLTGADSRHVTKKGLRTVLKACAQVVLKHHRGERKPLWLRLYEEDVWAWREADRTWKVRLSGSLSDRDRERVINDAYRRGVHLRSDHQTIYRWATAHFYRGRHAEQLP